MHVGTDLHGAVLRPAQTGRRDHLHCLGDLSRVLDAANATPKIQYICHGYLTAATSFFSLRAARKSALQSLIACVRRALMSSSSAFLLTMSARTVLLDSR